VSKTPNTPERRINSTKFTITQEDRILFGY